MVRITRPRVLSRRDALKLMGAGGVVGAAALVGGCGRSPSSGSGSGTFTLYTDPPRAGYESYQGVVAQFEKDHGITVNWQTYQDQDLQTRMMADFASGETADLVTLGGGARAVSYAVTGDLLPLDDYIAKDGAEMGFPDDWQPRSVDSWKHGGKTYGIQIHLTCNQLYYNRQMLADAGYPEPPATWDEFLDVARALTADGVSGAVLNQDASFSWGWLLQNDVTYFDAEAGTVLWPRDAAVAAMKFQQDLVHKYQISPAPTPSSDPAGPQKLFSAKRAGMIFTGPWDIGPIRTGSPDIDLGLAAPLEGRSRRTYAAGQGVVIPTAAKNPDLAWDLIKRLTSLEVELETTAETGMTMPRKSWAASAEVQDDPTVVAIADALPYAEDFEYPMAATGKAPEVYAEFENFYQAVVTQGEDVAAAVESFADVAGSILA